MIVFCLAFNRYMGHAMEAAGGQGVMTRLSIPETPLM